MKSDGVPDCKGQSHLDLYVWGLRLGELRRTSSFYAIARATARYQDRRLRAVGRARSDA